MPVPDAAPPRAVCDGCGASAELTEPGHLADPDGTVVCPPESGCCQEDHGPGGHAGDACDRTLTIYAAASLVAHSQS